MVNKHVYKLVNDRRFTGSIKDELFETAIKDDGIYSTFDLKSCWNHNFKCKELHLYYSKLGYSENDGRFVKKITKNIFYTDCPELGDVRLPYVSAESLKRAADRITVNEAKNDAIWSTIKVEPFTDHFNVRYDKAYVEAVTDLQNKVDKDLNITSERLQKYAESDAKATEEALTNLRDKVYAEAGIKAAGQPMTAQEMEIENTKRTLQRLRENSYYGLYPRNAFDEMSKQSLKKTLEIWKAKADLDIHSPSEELLFNCYNKQNTKEEKEKKDMNVTLMVVPEGMSKDFVNEVKARFQSNNSIRLFVASTDIGFRCPYGLIRTKYDLFEDWVKRGKVDIVYFMIGFEKDPDVRAFESFVRGITEFSGKVDLRVAYQKNDIINDINSLRTAYFEEADANKDLGEAFDRVTKEVKTMHDSYGLDDEGLEAIKNSNGQIDAYEELVMGKIMDTAFTSDEDDDPKPAKKGGKK